MRIFRCTDGIQVNEAGVGAGAEDEGNRSKSQRPVDWVGFDGPVKLVAWSGPQALRTLAAWNQLETHGGASNSTSTRGREVLAGGDNWVAAVGGRTLMVAPACLPSGESPILCVAPGAEGGGPDRPRWALAVSWCR